MRREERTLRILDFSGIFSERDFEEWEPQVLDFTRLAGTNCYCDEEAVQTILTRIEPLPVAGIHLIDSGNYHYLTRLWLQKLTEPFQLLVLDNHTDMQPPAFGGILSCGGWVQNSLEELPCLKKVTLVGPPKEAYEECEDSQKSRVHYVSREELLKARMSAEGVDLFVSKVLQGLERSLPLYVSIDLDVLCPKNARTTWSQGEMELSELQSLLTHVLEVCGEQQIPLLGVDLCGACDPKDSDGNQKNIDTDRALIAQILGEQNEK